MGGTAVLVEGRDGRVSWRRNLFAVAAASFVGFTGFTLVMPFLPLYIAQLGVTDVGEVAMWTGLALGASPAITALLSPLWGKVADRFGRKILVERSLVSFIIIMAATAYVTKPWHIVALRCLQGLFAGYGGLCLAMAAESVPRERMASAIGVVQTAQRLGPALGPVIGGLIAGVVGLRHAFFVTAGLYAVALIVVVVMYREERPASAPAAGAPETTDDPLASAGGLKVGEAAAAEQRIGFRAIVRLPNFALLMGVLFGLQFADRSFGPILPLHVEALGVSHGRVALVTGILFSILAGSAALGHHLCGRLIARVPARRIIIGGISLAGVGATAFVVLANVVLLAPALAVFGVGIGSAMTASYATAGLVLPDPVRASGFGLLTGAALTGLAITPVCVGIIATSSIRLVFVLDVAALAILAIVVRRLMISPSWRARG